LKAEVADLIEKCHIINNKKVAINNKIAKLAAKKAVLKGKLRFITTLVFFIYKGPAPF